MPAVGEVRITTELQKAAALCTLSAIANMSLNRSKSSDTGVLCKILFPRASESRGRTDLRFLLLSVMLGLIVCGCVGVMLWVMNYYSSHSP